MLVWLGIFWLVCNEDLRKTVVFPTNLMDPAHVAVSCGPPHCRQHPLSYFLLNETKAPFPQQESTGQKVKRSRCQSPVWRCPPVFHPTTGDSLSTKQSSSKGTQPGKNIQSDVRNLPHTQFYPLIFNTTGFSFPFANSSQRRDMVWIYAFEAELFFSSSSNFRNLSVLIMHDEQESRAKRQRNSRFITQQRNASIHVNCRISAVCCSPFGTITLKIPLFPCQALQQTNECFITYLWRRKLSP